MGLSPLKMFESTAVFFLQKTKTASEEEVGFLPGVLLFLYLYLCLQVCGLLWALLSNAALTLSLLSYRFVESFSAASQPLESWTPYAIFQYIAIALDSFLAPHVLVQCLATFICLYTPLLIGWNLAHSAFKNAWLSTSNFQDAALWISKGVNKTVNSEKDPSYKMLYMSNKMLYVLIAALLPAFLCAGLLLLSTVVCSLGENDVSCGLSALPPLCDHPILSVVSKSKPVQRHLIMSLLFQATLHLCQAAVFFFGSAKADPDPPRSWHQTLKESIGHDGLQLLALTSFDVIGGVLFLLSFFSSSYEACRLFGIVSAPLPPLLTLAALLPACFLFVATLVIALLVSDNRPPAELTRLTSGVQLTEFFRRCKNCFLVSTILCFFAQAVNPSVGFVEAQISFTLITFVGPLVHVMVGALVRVALALSVFGEEPVGRYFSRLAAVLSLCIVGANIVTHFSSVKGSLTSTFVCFWLVRGVLKILPSREEVEPPPPSDGQHTQKPARRPGAAILRTVTHFSGFVSLVVLFISLMTYLQSQADWYPDLISYQKMSDGPLVVKHAYVCKLELFSSSLDSEGSTKNINSTDAVNPTPRYASCGQKWSGLTLLDYALLSEAAYFDDKFTKLDDVVPALFGGHRSGKGHLFQVAVPEQEKRKVGGAQFFTASSDELNVHVVAVRGTDVGRLRDLMEDISLFKEPVFLSLLSFFFPTIRLWPDSAAAYVVDSISRSVSFFGVHESKKYYHSVLDHVRELRGRGDGKDVVLTGHSLGGGIARVVAAIEGIPSIGFSPPGVGQSYMKFLGPESSPHRLHHMSIAVVPEHDVVPSTDAQVGFLQRIECGESSQAHLNSCHMLEGTIKTLLNSCGDERGRFSEAKFTFGTEGLLLQTWTKASEEIDDILALICFVFVVWFLVRFYD